MKKIFFLTVLICSLLLITACGGGEPVETTAAPTTTTAATTTAPPRYTATFYDEAGTLLGTCMVQQGIVPSYSYEKADTAEWDYTFDGWSLTQGGDVLASLPTATADASYYAVVSAVKRSYTVTFNTGDGSAVAPITKEYGSTVAAPAAPTLDGETFTDGKGLPARPRHRL